MTNTIVEQVKIFNGSLTEVEKQVNSWRNENKSVEIISRQFQIDSSTSGAIAIFYKKA